MCGIVGMVTRSKYGPTKNEEDSFYDMLYADVLRGDDSTGVILVEKTSAFTVMKDQWQPWWFIPEVRDSAHGKRMFTQGKAFIGHNRKATVGTVSSETAHPFTVKGTFAMVHNGTIRNHKTFGDHKVDSESLAHLLEPVLGPNYTKEKFEEAIGKVDGAYAVVAYCQTNHKLYMFRNSERPLAIIKTKDQIYFGSEWGLMSWCAGRNAIDLKDMESEMLPPHTLMTIDLETNEIVKEEYVPKKATPQHGATMHHTPNGGKSKWAKTKGHPSGAAGNDEEGGEGVLSKIELKRLRRQFLGTTIEFMADDYVETDFPNTIDKGSTQVNLMGTTDELGHDHYCLGTFDLPPKHSDKLIDCPYLGRVESLTYDKRTKNLVLHLTAIRPVPVVKAKNEAATTLH
jgi:predicted glutamine amidotransferase